MPTAPVIALLSDFGTQDPYAAIMKAVISRLAPGTAIVDITHEIPAGDVRRAAFVLWQACPYFPTGSVFLAVVDPGVGTDRRAIRLDTNRRIFIGPDNGLFTYILTPDCQAWELQNPEYQLENLSSTFHGRDIFAPAAAYSALNIEGKKFGDRVTDPLTFPLPLLESPTPGRITGEILHADRYGNLVTSLGCFQAQGDQFMLRPWIGDLPTRPLSPSEWVLKLPNGLTPPWVHAFADLPPHALGVLIGSTGLLEIVARGGSAADLLQLSPETQVSLFRRGS
ncbi:MAG: SAM-dependent chlorinase/fluorinase [Chloroflexota bacterium]